MESPDVVIVGAGWCGLIAAKTYRQVKPEAKVLIIDNASSLGGTWCKERIYPHLIAEVHHGLFEFSDLEMLNDRQNVTESGLVSGVAVHQYLDNFATKFHLHECIRLNTHVKKAIRSGKYWCIELAGSKEIITCERLIVATGLTSEPFIPNIPNHGFSGEVMHSKDMGTAETASKLMDKAIQRVVVYGGSKSAFDAVNMILQAGKSVQWIVRTGKGGPSIMTPLTVLGQPSFRFNNSRFLALLSPSLFFQDRLARWLHSNGPIWLTQRLVLGFWRIIGHLLMREARYGTSENSKSLKPVMGLDSLFWSPATIGVMNHPPLWEDIHQGKKVRVWQNAIQQLEEDGIQLDDGTHIDADMVIFCTGWKSFPDNFMFSNEDRLDLGLPSPAFFRPDIQQRWETLRRQGDLEITQRLPILAQSPLWGCCHPRVEDDFHLYKSIIPASANENDRSLAYVGFLRTTGAPIVYEAQALWAVAYLQGKLKVPSRDERERETAATNAWFRRRYLCGRKVPFAMFDFLPYIDSLYRDLEVNSRRKSNPISELFGLYKPRNFRGVVNEWLESQRMSERDLRNAKTRHHSFLTVMMVVGSVSAAVFYNNLIREWVMRMGKALKEG